MPPPAPHGGEAAPVPASAWRCRHAFTIVELLAVIAAIGILAALIVGLAPGVQATSRKARAQAELETLAGALEGYRRHYGDYPHTRGASGDDEHSRLLFEALGGNLGPGDLAAGRGALQSRLATKGPRFLETGRIPLTSDLAAAFGGDATAFDTTTAAPSTDIAFADPWGRPYRYAYRDTSGWRNPSFVLWSVGADGTSGVSLDPVSGVATRVAGSDDILADAD